ncbi:AAA family ATPase [Sphingobacterium faecale]|uniref:AAA family ATPase n=1 Tax=Sphingobacterium faecale TaxID=2803775 RepID=A0ABS1R1Z6_9SPHI|nr:AAA family ATPase [Sphingobacterium faecale]MBL1408707.1 AAA family ATPase [Sphingobacterium faecale]
MKGNHIPHALDLQSYCLSGEKREISLATVSMIRSSDYGTIASSRFFVHYFGTMPHSEKRHDLDCSQCLPWLLQQFSGQIIDCHYEKSFDDKQKMMTFDLVYLFISGGLMLIIDFNRNSIYFYYHCYPQQQIHQLWDALQQFQQVEKFDDAKVSFMVQYRNDLDTQRMDIKKPEIDIDRHYNDDFKDIDQIIQSRLRLEKDKGIVLLHGKPGTGKTSYIRHLIHHIDKEVIFVPVQLAQDLAGPQLLTFFIEHPNSIFVIEDAENLVIDREVQGMSAVSALLNFTDGLLADSLGIQFVCTFNTDLSRVDKALLRKGRLIAQYEFGLLARDKAQVLSDSLGYDTHISEAMSLAAIFHQDEQPQQRTVSSHRAVGFKIA